MAEQPPLKQTSPVSMVLRTLGMTREDLVVHTEQFRAHLYQDNPSEPDLLPVVKARPLRRSRTTPLPNSTVRTRSPSPPRTPVKSEPVDVPIPPRQMDTMQLVMERKSKQAKRERKASLSFSQDTRRVSGGHKATPTRMSTPQLGPDTPHHYRYYSERVIGEASTSQLTLDNHRHQVPQTPTRPASSLKVSTVFARLPKTPVSRHLHAHSSSRASTPCSSPAPIVNIVSSPGPINYDPIGDDEDDLPYTLPPGPYSKEKPDYSYAALIGQAILSSPEHRLTLQDIYEWITSVYPYYTRGEQTWMNSVRHSLSTMAVFRKVPRGRNEGKSLWAILDCDLPCFEGGSFRKNLCADMIKAKAAKSGPKRKIMEETLAREPKKRKKSGGKDVAESSSKPAALPSMYTAPFIPPFYAPLYPTAQQQPYYANYITQPLPAEVIFPPLPPQSAFHRLAASRVAASEAKLVTSESQSDLQGSTDAAETYRSSHSPRGDKIPKTKESLKIPSSSSLSIMSPSSASSVSLLVFTPNCSSSSTLSPPPSSEPDYDESEETASEPAPSETTEAATDYFRSVDSEDEVDRLTRQWLASPSAIEEFEGPSPKSTPEGHSVGRKVYKLLNNSSEFACPQSPTPFGRTGSSKSYLLKDLSGPDCATPVPTERDTRFVTPPRHSIPRTPPRKRTTSGTSIRLSAQKTPISHRGLHMSPSSSASLAHYKSNLDPPPPAVFKPMVHAPLLLGIANDDPSLILPNPETTRTPSRKRNSPHAGGSGSQDKPTYAPVTPRRLFSDESPDPDLRPIVDPHDPSALIDDEVLRLGSQPSDGSPDGFFAPRDHLYESPSIPSPARWERYW